MPSACGLKTDPPPNLQILKQRNVSLEDLLEHDEIVSECKCMNPQLVNFLTRPSILEQLVKYVIDCPPPETGDSRSESKRPYLASELFVCENPDICDTLFRQRELLGLLFSFLDQDAPIDPGRASYFCKVVVALLSKDHQRTVAYIRDTGLMEKFLNHIGRSHVLIQLYEHANNSPTLSSTTVCDRCRPI